MTRSKKLCLAAMLLTVPLFWFALLDVAVHAATL